MYMLEVNGAKVLLECGLYQGRREESIERNRHFPFDPSELDCCVVSHAHIDHVGNLPNLCRQGFSGNIYATYATRDLAAIMLEDSAGIQKDDAEFVSRQRAKKGLPPVEPLYSSNDAERALRQFVTFNYDRPMPIADGLTVTFRDAGHILGSAQVVLDVREGGRAFRYLFSGDVGRGGDDILRDPEPVENVDFLQIEATYGGRVHSAKKDAEEELRVLVSETLARGGKVIIPAFSVGRTQQIVFELHQLIDDRRLQPVPIYVDSPLSTNATEVYRLHPECFNEFIHAFLREKSNPFGMENLHPRTGALEETQRTQGPGDHHQRFGHGGGGAGAASPAQQYRRREKSGSLHRLLRGTHAGVPDFARPESCQHLRRAAGGAGAHRVHRRFLRPRGSRGTQALRRAVDW
jgi:metallo-beta-lactamase family protein